MFYFEYLMAELTRRWSKTLIMALGLAIASAIIVVIVSLSTSLSRTQKTVLNPLENVGTDIMLTRTVDLDKRENLPTSALEDFRSQNQTSTDLAKLGNPGDDFSRDNFTSGTLLTFNQSELDKLTAEPIGAWSAGLLLNLIHQEGKIPNVTAEFKTGGEKIQYNQEFSDEQRQAFQDAQKIAEEEIRAKGVDPRSEGGRQAVQDAMKDHLPSISGEVIVPEKTYRQDIGSISTDIKNENYKIGGVDIAKTAIGLILPSEIVEGKFLEGNDQAVLNRSYASTKGIKIGDKITVNNQSFQVVSIAEPQFYTNTADIYLTLIALQNLTGKNNQVNLALIKAKSSGQVASAGAEAKKIFDGAKVASSADMAKEISGSLITATNLTNNFVGIVSVVIALASFVITGLLTIISINKRTRELGTLKAIGWKNSLVIRQIIMENLFIGIIGAISGIGLGVLGIYFFNQFGITFSANVQNSGAFTGMMSRFSQNNNQNVTSSIPLSINYQIAIMLLGAGVAIVGALVAGFFGALKITKLKPQEALRNLE